MARGALDLVDQATSPYVAILEYDSLVAEPPQSMPLVQARTLDQNSSVAAQAERLAKRARGGPTEWVAPAPKRKRLANDGRIRDRARQAWRSQQASTSLGTHAGTWAGPAAIYQHSQHNVSRSTLFPTPIFDLGAHEIDIEDVDVSHELHYQPESPPDEPIVQTCLLDDGSILVLIVQVDSSVRTIRIDPPPAH